MPITFAHPAAVLPFGRYLPMGALVAGALAPDVGYYLPIPVDVNTHSLTGLLGVDLVLGLALLLGFRFSAGPAAALFPYRVALPVPLVTRPSADAPADGVDRSASRSTGRSAGSSRHRIRLPPRRSAAGSWCGMGAIVVAIWVGAATHLAWDSCTQTAGFVVRHWAALRAPVIGPHRVYNVVGYVSSVLGSLVLAWYVVRHARRESTVRSLFPRRSVLVILCAATALGATIAVDDPVTRTSAYDLVRHTIVGAAQGLGCAWTIYAVLWHVTTAGSRRRAPTAEGQGDDEGQGRDTGGGAERGGHAADQGVRG
ncbi:DUF4184 family protein [Nocardia asteroides NBRC 15531]|uniref:DUF4184 family protein n=1 Tax=Nocardia asteroides NBRC 15531 TaxID=1110697 RepID=U5EMS4_NOCAS|nr:DUF4184 family protein [Nocardia asteroides]TLF62787.1 DUF4184 family protein [Nocardia asteroides NBRC 15531]UGT46442.1 DUF4184 family protein [Nocardia asteroides]SFN56781.1 protein of unknown function [Nocardia asteroides]VEG34738.1 Uncharacterised protein [Nocardia asteroides]GAD87656.1 hypothetical protein NCAST_36_00380 [Nocardia asteroides NBRC 15531]